jgi:chaperonin cofactor prefoldin
MLYETDRFFGTVFYEMATMESVKDINEKTEAYDRALTAWKRCDELREQNEALKTEVRQLRSRTETRFDITKQARYTKFKHDRIRFKVRRNS